MQAPSPTQQKLIDYCINGGYWEPPDESVCFTLAHRDDLRTVNTRMFGPILPQDPGRIVTLHYVQQSTPEFEAVQQAARTGGKCPTPNLAHIFRVQNYARAAEFYEFEKQAQEKQGGPSTLCFGFHGLAEHNMDWPSLLVNGVDPNRCTSGAYGYGAYFAPKAALSLNHYTKKFHSPVYKDALDPHNEPRMDTYAFLGMYLLNLGTSQYVTPRGKDPPDFIPAPHSAFRSPQSTEICLQDYARACPAYFLLYTQPMAKTINPEMAETFNAPAIWDYPLDGSHNARSSVYWLKGDDEFKAMDSALRSKQDNKVDESGLWDPRLNPRRDLACRICKKELGWLPPQAGISPRDSFPVFDRWTETISHYPTQPK